MRETARQEALVRFAFSDVLRANEADDPVPMSHFRLKDGRYDARDLALLSDGELAAPVQRDRHALERLSEREDLRDAPSRYGACSLTLVKCRGGPEECGVHAGYPVPRSLLDYNRMFRRLLTTEHGPKEDISIALKGDISIAVRGGDRAALFVRHIG